MYEKPYVILTALRALDAKPEDCLMVGDSTADIAAARAAGVKVCVTTYGYGHPDATLPEPTPTTGSPISANSYDADHCRGIPEHQLSARRPRFHRRPGHQPQRW